MSQIVATLQNAVNRFAAVGSFPRVAVDGLWGSRTVQGIYSSLAFLGLGKCYQSLCPHEETSATAARLMAQWDESQTAASGLAEFLNSAANSIGLPHVASPVPGGGTGPIIPTTPGVPTAALQITLLDRLRALPMWQQILLGIGTALGLVLIVNRVARAKRA